MRASFRRTLVVCCASIAAMASSCPPEKVDPLTPSNPISVIVTPSQVSLEVGKAQTLTAQVVGGDINTNRALAWAAASPVVTIDSTSGNATNATCQSVGTSGVTATSLAQTTARATSTIACTAPPPPPVVLINVSPGSPVDVNVNRNAQNEHVCTFTIENIAAGAIAVAYAVNHAGLATNVSTASIARGRSGSASVFYRGPQNAPFSATFSVVATGPDGSKQEKQVTMNIGFR